MSRDRLKEWVKTLSIDQKDKIILELTSFAINAEYVKFYDDSKTPFYDGDGENLDGTEREECEEDDF